MTVQEIRKVRWIKADWENMKVLACNTGIITLGMVETFVEGVCNSLARDFDNVEEEMIELVKENNKEFYKMVEALFSEKSEARMINFESDEYKALTNTFRIPDVDFLKATRIEQMMELYAEMSPFERIEFNCWVDDFEVEFLEGEHS